ncbi:uncharacterized protein KGF55_005763 [Candida pseudojiufengensis]|uniref:uncharacterized protein n=1 Tax=Candida pseudojiufengensis TaxID=497109 RepID=UPI002224DF1E|nr:uncharacterized protein KGF55_005763 [Candida pseudojiufengensis]KAI5958503.1 hypothetical protein KGF55_005763 [Candida pseudojiufengensis]
MSFNEKPSSTWFQRTLKQIQSISVHILASSFQVQTSMSAPVLMLMMSVSGDGMLGPMDVIGDQVSVETVQVVKNDQNVSYQELSRSSASGANQGTGQIDSKVLNPETLKVNSLRVFDAVVSDFDILELFDSSEKGLSTVNKTFMAPVLL